MDALWTTSTLIWEEAMEGHEAERCGCAPCGCDGAGDEAGPTHAHLVAACDKVRVRRCAVGVTDNEQRHVRLLTGRGGRADEVFLLGR